MLVDILNERVRTHVHALSHRFQGDLVMPQSIDEPFLRRVLTCQERVGTDPAMVPLSADSGNSKNTGGYKGQYLFSIHGNSMALVDRREVPVTFTFQSY